MKLKIMILIGTILLTQNVSFSYNTKQINYEKEKNIEYEKLLEYISRNKLIINKMLILSDYYESFDSDNRGTLYKNIKNDIEKYKSNPKNKNYIYAQKAYNLYSDIIKIAQKSLPDCEENIKLKEKTITLPDNVYNTLDKSLIENIIMLNVMINHL